MPFRSANEPLRLVLDTNVWLDLLVFDDPRCAGLREQVSTGSAVVLTRADCRTEWLRVLGYPALALDPPTVGHLVSQFDTMATLWNAGAEPVVSVRLPRCRDPDDQMFLELARDAGASHLLTRDEELLRLSRRCARQGLFAILRPEDLAQHAGEPFPHPGCQAPANT